MARTTSKYVFRYGNQATVGWLGSVVLTPFSVQETTMQHLELFAADGLRTLCLAVKELDRDTYDEWNAKYNQAALQISGREAAVPTTLLAGLLVFPS
jgi:magnesium-transporting ATPase (P-type)